MLILHASTKHTLVVEGNADIEMYADSMRIEQVLVNLVSNAAKYSPGAEKVIIRVEQFAEGVEISVTDFGIGIPESKIPLIFDRFYQVDDKSHKYAGLGLGLYISAEIIKNHNSHIHIESEEGKGPTFRFGIPTTKAEVGI